MNIWDIVITVVILINIGFALWKIRKDKKNGKSCCGGDCSSCNRKCQ